MDITLLTEEQIWGDDNGNGQLDVMEKYGTKVAPTDLAVLLGGIMNGSTGTRTSENDITCTSWSASSYGFDDVRCVGCKGDEDWDFTHERSISARPALSPSAASKISPKNTHKGPNDVLIGEYGEYPQTVADKETDKKLERLLGIGSLRPTGKSYTFDSIDTYDYDMPFKATSYPEYELDGKKYIRVPGRPADKDSRLSTYEQVEKDKPYWVQVQPIEWLMDPSGYWVSKKCLFAGIQFDTHGRYYGDFSKTFMKHYLDTYFAKEMIPSLTKEEQERLAKQQAEAERIANMTPAEREAEHREKMARLQERLRIRREERDASKAELERVRAERRATEKRVADLTAERDRLRQQLAALKAAQPMGNRPTRQPTSTPRNPNDGR